MQPSPSRHTMTDDELQQWMARRRDCCPFLESMPGDTTADAMSSPKKSRRGRGRGSPKKLRRSLGSIEVLPVQCQLAVFDVSAGGEKQIIGDDECDVANTEMVKCESDEVDKGSLAHGDFRISPAPYWTTLYAKFACSDDLDTVLCPVCDGTEMLLDDPCPLCADAASNPITPLSAPYSPCSNVERSSDEQSEDCLFCADDETRQVKFLDSPCTDDQCDLHDADKSFVISLDRSTGEKLGIDVECLGDGTPLLIDGITDGLVRAWNAEHPNEQVNCGDRLMEANGASDQIQLVEECQKVGVLKLRLLRVSEKHKSPSVDAHRDDHSTSAQHFESLAPEVHIEMCTSAQHSESLAPESCASLGAPHVEKTSELCNEPRTNSRSLPMRVSGRVHLGLGFMKGKAEKVFAVPAQMSDKVQKDLVYAKGQAQVASVVISSVPAQMSHKVQKDLEYAKGQAQVVSAAISVQMSQKAQKGLNFARRLGKAGGA